MTDSKNKTILLVEDEQIIALTGIKVLENHGFSVVHVTTGEEAVETVLKNPNINLILMDIDLGEGIDGTRAAEIILEKHNIPLVFLSSHTEPEVVEKTEGITSYGYVVKNTGETVLIASIRMAFKLHEAYKDIQNHCEDSAAANEELEASNEELQAAMEELEAANEELIESQAEIIARDKELSLSEKRFRSMVECSPIPIFIQTEKKFAYLNPAALNLFGAENENQLLDTPVFDRFHPDFHDLVKERIKNLNENKIAVKDTLEQKYLRLDGSEVWVETVAEPIQYNEKHGALVFVLDITERRHHSEEKKSWNDLMEYIIHHDPNAVAVLDKNLNFRFVSDRFLRDYRVSYSDVINKHHYDAFPEIPDKWRQIHKRALEGEVLSSEEDFFQRPDGSIDYTSWQCRPWFENDGSIGGIILYTEVITKRKLAELEAKEYSGNLKERIKELNCLYSVSELVNRPDIYYDEVFQQCVENIRNAFCFPDITACRIVWQDLEYTTGKFKKNKKVISTDIISQGVKKGEIEVYLKENPDSETKVFLLKEEKRLIKTIAELIGRSDEQKQAEDKIKSQLAEKETLLREVHHQIKNNINHVESFLRLQADDIENPEAVSAIQDAVSRIHGMRLIYEKLLISDDYSGINVKNYLEELISSIINIFPEQKNITIEHKFDDFIIDVKRLQSIGVILNELLTNVMKHAFSGKDSGRVQLNLENYEENVKLIIQDNGIGLPPEFDLEKNRGLGLMLVKILSEQMNGSFTMENNNGTKSIVEFKR